ncbi:MAG: TolB family protein [Saprospiraceae bacterium]
MSRITFIIIVLLLSSCKEDDTTVSVPPSYIVPVLPAICNYSIDDFTELAENKDSIVDLSACVVGGLENYIEVEKYSYSYPCFNPNNAEEIAYIRRKNGVFTGCNFELWTFNFCTGEKRFVTDGICYSIDWSVKDWLVFTGQDRQLYKVKSNGDSLLQLTFSGNFNSFAMWNSIGDKLAYVKSTDGSEFYLTDSDGIHTDTIPEMILGAYWHWSLTDKYFSCVTRNADNEMAPAIFNLADREFLTMSHVDPTIYGYIHDTDWISETEMVWLGTGKSSSIGFNDIITQEERILAKGYQNRKYHNLAVSPDGSSIVTEREDLFQISDCDIEVRRNLYIIDVDGSNERIIKIPE